MNDVCSLELLTNAVANRLTADEETALYDHLERCQACCARMEQLAGGEQWQQEAAALLTTDELDAAVPEPTVWSEVDFSVEHLEPSEDANVLGQLGGYDVLAIIGRGGMGVVLKAFDRELKRFVAIKALSPHLAHSSVARKRFAREAQAAAAVVNPHVIAIHHVQPTGRLPFLIMPLLTGESLAQRLKSRAPLELTEVLRIGMQAAVGLAAAHDQGLVHRDVKPANIFLEKGVERVVITDFGLARAADDVSMTRLGVVAGTPEYMSPEQARGEALNGRSDLFSLGCVLYEMATGVSPFRSDSTIATLRRIVDDKPAAIASLAPELPPWFSYIVERLLSKDPAQRFTSANEVALLLEQCLSHLQQPTSVPLPASLLPHANARRSIFNSNNKGILTMLGTLGTALLGMVLWQATEAPDISGQWTSDEWGTVVLESTEPGRYVGTLTNAFFALGTGRHAHPKWQGANCASCHEGATGKIELKWARLENRFNGTWSHPENQTGKLSLRLVEGEIRGAWTVSKKSEANPGTPRLGDLTWKRTRDRTPVVAAAELEKQIQLAGRDLFYGRMELTQEFKTLWTTKDQKRETVISTGTARWLKKDGMTRIESERMVPGKGTLELQPEQWTTGQDGKQSYAWDRTAGTICYGALRPGSLAYAPNLFFWGRSGIAFPQPMFGPNPTITTVARDGHNEINVDVVDPPSKSVVRYVGIAPSRGYLPTRVETRTGDRLISQVEFQDFFEPRPGVWAARTIMWTAWSDENDVDGKPILASRTKFTVTRLELGDDAQLQDQEFSLKLPDNVKVVDTAYTSDSQKPCPCPFCETESKTIRQEIQANEAWSSDLPASEELDAYVAAIRTLPDSPTERFKFYWTHLEHVNETIADDSSKEIAFALHEHCNADFRSFDFKPVVDLKQLRLWLKDAHVSEYRRRVYIRLLGVCGNDEDIEVLKRTIGNGVRENPNPNLEAQIEAYVSLGGPAAWDFVEQKCLQDDINIPDTSIYSMIRAVRFLDTHSKVIPRDRLLQSLHLMLDRPSLADLVVKELIRMEDWSQVRRLVDLLKSADEDSKWVRLPIVQYLQACPLPEAADELKKLREISKAVERALQQSQKSPNTSEARSLNHENNVDNDQARQLRTEAATQTTGKQLGTVLGKPIHEGDINKNTSTRDNLMRLVLQPLTEDYCLKNGLGRVDELNARIKDERSRRMASMLVFQWELQRHLYEKHGGRVEVSAFGNVAFDGMRKWLDERERAGDFEITDPQLKTELKELYNHVPPGTMFAKPDQLETAFDPANVDRFIETYATIPAGAHRDPAQKLVGMLFDQPIYLHERYLDNKAELPGLLNNLIVPELEERYRKQHPEVEPTDAEIDDLVAKTKANLIQSAIEQRKSLEAALQRQRLADPTSTKEVPGTQAFIEQVDETLKQLEANDGRSQATESLRKVKLQKHIYENYGGGRAIMGGSQGLVLVDAQKQWLDERERLGEFQIANNEFRKLLESYGTIESHPGSKLVEGTDLRAFFDFNLPYKLPSIQHQSNREARTLDGEKATINNEQTRQLPREDATISISDFKQLNEAKQVAWLKEAVMRFQKESGNISATVVMSTQNFEYEPTSQKRSTVLLTTGRTHNYQIRRIDHSYQVRHTQKRVQHKENGAYTANIAHWDAVAGRLRQHDDVRSDSGDHKSQGTIRPERDDIAKDCFFLQYLGDDSHGEADAIPELWNPAGRYLQNMEHARVVEIRDSDSTVKIAFPCKMPWGATAESELIFDLAKSGLLIDMTLTELAAEKEITVALRRHRMTMTQPVLVEEVWLPTKFEMTAWSQNYPKQITVFMGKVSDIQLNRLTAADLEVVFPPGTEVSDKFTGERYVVPVPAVED